jgi:hypothetical protein
MLLALPTRQRPPRQRLRSNGLTGSDVDAPSGKPTFRSFRKNRFTRCARASTPPPEARVGDPACGGRKKNYPTFTASMNACSTLRAGAVFEGKEGLFS